MSEMQYLNCESIEPLLSAYVLEEASADEKAAVSEHLVVCPKCREEVDLLRSTADLIAKSSPAPAALGASQRAGILSAASAASRPGAPRRRPTVLYWAGGLAAAGLAALSLWMFWTTRSDTEQPVARDASEVKTEGVEIAILEKRGEQPLFEAAKPAESAPSPESARPNAAATDLAHRATGPEAAAIVVDEKRKQPEARFFGVNEPAKEVATGFRALERVDRMKSVETEALLAEIPQGTSLNKLTDLNTDYSGPQTGARASLGVDGGVAAGRGEGLSQDRKLRELELALAPPVDRGAALDGEAATRGIQQLRTELKRAAPASAPAPVKSNETRDSYRFAGIPPTPDKDKADVLLKGAEVAKGEAGGVAEEAPRPASVATAASKPTSLAAVAPKPESFPIAKKSIPASPASGPEAKPADTPQQTTAQQTPAQGLPSAGGAAPGHEAKGGGTTFQLGFAPDLKVSGLEPPRAEGLARQPGGIPQLTSNGTAVKPGLEWREGVDQILSRLDRKPGETPGMMFFRYWGDNPFVEASTDNLSTFGADVDTASYTLFRNYLFQQGVLPPKEAVRTEEFVNYFKGRYDPPTDEGRAFALRIECSPSPFAHEPEYKLLRIGIKGKEVSKEKRKACSLVFVIDTSGSMRQGNRLELVKDGLRLLVKELDEGDTVGIVAFDFEARTILDPTPASERERIIDAVSRLEPRRNTNVAAGLELGYRMAGSKLLKDGVNRVILLSDGVANTGITSSTSMLEQVRTEREKGISLTTVGVGMGNLNDALLQELADKGNGQCIYVDRVEEARKAFVDNLTGTLETIAKNVKIQVEFDPARVLRYRLLGYEKRAIADADFRNNKIDAGEIGAGHEVTALYELKLKADANGKFATVRVRNETVDHGEQQESAHEVETSAIRGAFGEASPRFRLHACAAELAEVLRDSYWARGNSLDRVASMLKDIMDLREREGGPRIGDDADVVELLALVERADALVRRRQTEADDVARTVDAIKDNLYLSARVEDELQRRNDQNRAQLDEIRRRNEELRRQLEGLLAR